MDIAQFEAQLKAEGYQTLATVSQPAGYHMGEHAHPFDACALVTQGEFSITVDGVAKRYVAGQIFRLPAGTVHTESAGGQGVQYRAGRRTQE
jgi:quercetin dioxygenase-like cupin family protein